MVWIGSDHIKNQSGINSKKGIELIDSKIAMDKLNKKGLDQVFNIFIFMNSLMIYLIESNEPIVPIESILKPLIL